MENLWTQAFGINHCQISINQCQLHDLVQKQADQMSVFMILTLMMFPTG